MAARRLLGSVQWLVRLVRRLLESGRCLVGLDRYRLALGRCRGADELSALLRQRRPNVKVLARQALPQRPGKVDLWIRPALVPVRREVRRAHLRWAVLGTLRRAVPAAPQLGPGAARLVASGMVRLVVSEEGRLVAPGAGQRVAPLRVQHRAAAVVLRRVVPGVPVVL